MPQPVLTRAALALGILLVLAPAGAAWGQACAAVVPPAPPSSPPAPPALPPLTGTPPALTGDCASGGSGSIAFTDVTGAILSTTYSSNAVTLGSNFPGSYTATCSGCTAIGRNGSWIGGTSAAGYTMGDTIAIRVTSSASTGATVTATVTVGGVTSNVWSVTSNSACSTGITAGGTCPDGSIFAGYTPDGNVPMYTTPCDVGQSLSGSCTGTRSTITWNNGTSNYGITGYNSQVMGQANTAGLYTLSDAGSPYKAAKICKELSANGHSDWYLPAKNELAVLYANQAAIGGFIADGTYYRSSSEQDSNSSWSIRFNDGVWYNTAKKGGYFVRCVRR